MMNRILLLLFLPFVLVQYCHAQNYIVHSKHYSLADGLPHRSVRCILQDKKGFIWLGTEGGGLCRFDGYSFVQYNKANNNLYNDVVTDILEAPDGMLWLFHKSYPLKIELDVFNPATGKAVPVNIYFKDKLPANFAYNWQGHAVADDGTIYMGAANPPGIVIYNAQSGFSFQPMPLNCAVTVDCMAADKLLFVWGTTLDTTVKNAILVNRHTWKIEERQHGLRYKPTYSRRNTAYNNIYYCTDKKYALITSTDASAKKVLPLLQKYGIKGNGPATFIDNERNLFWADSLIFNLQTGQPVVNVQSILPSYESAYDLADWLIDPTGAVWICSPSGLTRISIIPNRFKQLLYNGKPGDKGTSVRGITGLPDKSVLANTENAAQYRIMPNGSTSLFINTPLSPIYSYSWGADSNGYIYTPAKNEANLLQCQPNGQIKSITWQDATAVWCITFIDKYRFWAGTVYNHGIVAADMRNAGLKDTFAYNDYEELKNAAVYHIQSVADGVIWICAETGLYKAYAGKGIVERYHTSGEAKYKLPADNVVHYYYDKDSVMWLATLDKGLVKWNTATGTFQVFGLQAGLPSLTVYSVYADSHQQLWLSTEKGIVQFDKAQNHTAYVYTTAEGITHNEFNRIAHYRASNGTLYMGGINGVNVFNPDSFYNAQAAAAVPLVVVKCTKYSSEQNSVVDITDQYASANGINLQPNDRFLSFDVALLTYNNTTAITYAYRFDTDSNWIYQTQPHLQFSGMPYGQHHIYIKAVSGNGVPGKNQLDILVVQLRPFYLRLWFLLLIAGTMLLGGIVFIRYRTRSLRLRQKQIEHEVKMATAQIAEQANEIEHLSNLKARFFTNVSHELRTPLTLIKGPISSLLNSKKLDEEQTKQVATADYHARQLHSLINELLDLSKLEAGKMQLQLSSVSLQPFLSYIVNAFDSHAVQQQVKLLFNYGITRRLNISTDADKLTKIINNLLSNAIKFTPAHGKVTVNVLEQDGNLLIQISDTGIGIHPDDQAHVFERFYQTSQADAPYTGGTGVGLTISYEFAQLLGGTITLNSSPGKGSTFALAIPIKETTEQEEYVNVQASESKAEQTPTGHHILIVEDNPAMQDYIRQVLARQYVVHCANNGALALEWLNTNKLPNLIVSDIMMPVMDGFELLHRLKASDKLRHLPVVMLTARAQIQDKLQALRIGVDDYLLKPFDEQELLARIANLLHNYTQRTITENEAAEPEILTTGEKTEPEQYATGSQAEQQWLTKIETLVLQNLTNPELSVEYMAKEIGVSRSTFLRQLKRLTGLTPTQYIDEIRFSAARRMLENKEVDSVKATAYSVGFTQVEHFSRMFHKRYGKYPSAYLI